jgi:predicted secreted acid phosphatase
VGGSFGSRPHATLPPVKTIFALIALLLPAGGSVALADEPVAPAPPEAVIAYHDSGEWRADTTSVVRRARRYVRRHLDDSSRRAAIVLDIDDTSLSNYDCLKEVDFARSSADCGDETLPAIPQTLALFRWAREHDVAVFFVTGRREAMRAATAASLRAAGYRGGWTLKMRPDEQPRRWRDGWKARVRRAIVERRGFRILANLGDQWSDLDGGYAARRFKLPNPMYVIPTA